VGEHEAPCACEIGRSNDLLGVPSGIT